MNIPFAAHTWIIVVLAALGALSAGASMVAVAKRRRSLFWPLFVGAVLASFGAAHFFLRLEALHTDLVNGSPGIKRKEDIIARYGAPSKTDTYVAEGETVECWIYDLTWFHPRIHTQFEMIKDVVWARLSSNPSE
jgi:hypothetical protein